MRFSPVLLASMAFSASLGGVSSAQAFELVSSGHLPQDQPDVVWVATSSSSLKSAVMSAKPSAATPKLPEPDSRITSGEAIAPEKPSTPSSHESLPTENNEEPSVVEAEAIAVQTAIFNQVAPPSFIIEPTMRLTDRPDAIGETTDKQTDLAQASPTAEEAGATSETDTTEAETSEPNPTDASTDALDPETDTAETAEPTSDTETPESEAPDTEVTEPDPTTLPDATPFTPPTTQERVLIIEVNVAGVDDRPELRDEVYQAIKTQPGQAATEAQLQDDINAIFATGYFSAVQAGLQDTPLGVRLNVSVTPNPILRSVKLEDSALAESGETLTFNNEELTIDQVVDAIFAPQYGRTLNRVPPEYAEGALNLGEFQVGVNELYQVYNDNGYVLAQVVDADISDDGDVTLVVAEGIIENIEVQFLDEDGFAEDEEGNPIEGKTRDFIITREFESQPGDVFNQRNIQQDLQNVFGLGIFDDVRVSLNPGDDPRKVDVVVNVIEGNTGSIAAGAGFSSASGFFGSASYQQQNLGGNNQNLGAEIQIGQRELLFDIRFTDPWIATDPYRTSYTVNTFLRRSISLIFDGGDTEVDLCERRNDLNCNQDDLTDGDRPRVQRLGGGVSFSRPLDEWLGLDNWRASAGFQYQRVSIRDGDGDISFIDALGNRLSFSDSGTDDLYLLQLAAVQDLRDNPQQPTRGSLLRFGTEQSIPLGSGSILLNRLRASYSRYIPVDITDFKDGPETLALNLQAGTVLGDLPPYEAFSLGGTDSVRGYDAGDLGSGRRFVQATAEYRFPLFSIIGGALFLDIGSDLGSASEVPGAPADVRDKPGTGFGYGLGVRIQSPLGQIRVDYGINDDGDGRIHFGIGERF